MVKLFAAPETAEHGEGHKPMPSARDGGAFQGAVSAFLGKYLLSG